MFFLASCMLASHACVTCLCDAKCSSRSMRLLRFAMCCIAANVKSPVSMHVLLALDDVERESGKRRFLVARLHVESRLVHRADHLVE